MPIMSEAISKENWERIDKGLPPIPEKKIVKLEPEFPSIDNVIKFSDINLDEFDELKNANRKIIKNKDGVSFLGYEMTVSFKPPKRPPGRLPKGQSADKFKIGRILGGWMPEGEFFKFYYKVRDKIQPNVISW